MTSFNFPLSSNIPGISGKKLLFFWGAAGVEKSKLLDYFRIHLVALNISQCHGTS